MKLVVYLWHVCNILGYVAYVESVMQVRVACVQLECCLHGACKHCVCIQFMCSKLVTFLHLVCLCMWKVCSLHMTSSGRYACTCSVRKAGFRTCVWHVWGVRSGCVQGECHVYVAFVWHVKSCVCGVRVPCIGVHVGHMQHACGIGAVCMRHVCGMHTV
jgi:hypothetical protein